MEGAQTRILAEALHELLAACKAERIDVPAGRWQANVLLMNCAGQVVQGVRARGRWVLVDFAHGITWACQLVGRSGIWAAAESGGKPGKTVGRKGKAAVLIAATFAARGGSAVRLELLGRPLFLTLPTDRVAAHASFHAMGPDPLDAAFDPDDFTARLRRSAGRTVAAALLDDEVVAGVGNVSKNEILFAAHLHPATRVGELFASDLDRLAQITVATVRRAYAALAAGERAALAVYDRAGEACPVCGEEILADRTGSDGRWTWHCPRCQKPRQSPTLFA